MSKQRKQSHSVALGIIGSEEIRNLDLFGDLDVVQVDGDGTKVTMRIGEIGGAKVCYASRGGFDERRKCHEIDYRSVIRALKAQGVQHVISTAMVGSLRPSLPVGHRCLLDQFLDFTKHRQFTYFVGGEFDFLDMTDPFCSDLRRVLLESGEESGNPLAPSGCYVGVDGPRYETRAEVAMYAHLGGNVIGMTVIPEVIMAREAGLCYATIAGVVNLGAGLGSAPLDAADFRPHRRDHVIAVEQILTDFFPRWNRYLTNGERCACPHTGHDHG